MADKSLLLALASSERSGSKPKIDTFYIQSLRFLLVQSLLLREAPYIPKHSFIHSFIHSLHYITLHYITLREDIILYLVMVLMVYITLHYITRRHYLIPCDGIDYIRLVTLDCITKTGSFMTCDGNILSIRTTTRLLRMRQMFHVKHGVDAPPTTCIRSPKRKWLSLRN